MDGKKFGAGGEMAEVVRGFVKRSLDPVKEHIRGLSERADKHYQKIEELEARIAALERSLNQKSGVVYLEKAGNR